MAGRMVMMSARQLDFQLAVLLGKMLAKLSDLHLVQPLERWLEPQRGSR